jgi:nitrogenase iron protein NifH
MSIYAANNIAKAITRLSRRARSRCALGGVICNAKNIEGEEDLVAEFARRINSQLIAYIPRSREVQIAELHKQTVVEYAPESDQAAVYEELGRAIYGNRKTSIPTPLEMDELESFAFESVQV